MKTTGWVLMVSTALLTLSFCTKKDAPGEEEQTGEGKADITLTAGGEKYTIKGPCGWASAAGNRYIGANDGSNSLKTFSAFFNLQEAPAKTTTYTLVSDSFDEDPAHITMNITEMKNGGLFEYNSTDNSGQLTLEVSGKKITVKLDGITLAPSTEDRGFYTSLNTGAFSNPGVLSGTLEFYVE